MKLTFFKIFILICFNDLFSKSVDSSKYNLSINLNTRKFNNFDEIYGKVGHFDNNRIYSGTINFEAIFAETKKYQFITNYGINFRRHSWLFE
ncbi:MAG: hypothetical protein HQ463_09585 [Bacteroidetes bacterium]|nr:hypothetical protein [Bacteroidota bacterium]